MFLYFLGLNSRLIRWPYATIAIILVTVGFSILEMARQPDYRKIEATLADTSGVWKARVAMTQALCSSLSTTDTVQPTRCQYLSATLKPTDFANIDAFIAAYKLKHGEDHGAGLAKWARWLKSEESYKFLESDVTQDSTVAAYMEALKTHRSLLLQSAKSQQRLMRGNARLLPAMKALFAHHGWYDFFMSMTLLCLFAFFLEQRVGPVGVLLFYLVGGIGGNILQGAVLPAGKVLVGSAPGVSALLGAFLVYFSQEKSYLCLNLLVYRRKFAFPAWTAIVGGWVASFVISWITGSQAGPIAYGVGLGLGCILASMQKDLLPLKKTFLFPDEEKKYYQAKQLSRFNEKVEVFQGIYQLNQESFYAFRHLFSYFEKHQLTINSFRDEDRQFIIQLVNECFLYTAKNEKYQFSQQVLSLIPLWWDLGTLGLSASANQLMDRAERFYETGFVIQALRCYDLFLEKFAAHPRAERAHAVIMQCFDEFEKYESSARVEMLEVLVDYAQVHPMTHLQAQIRRLSQQVEKERQRGAA